MKPATITREDPRAIQRGFDRFAQFRELRRNAMAAGEPGLLFGVSLLACIAAVTTLLIVVAG